MSLPTQLASSQPDDAAEALIHAGDRLASTAMQEAIELYRRAHHITTSPDLQRRLEERLFLVAKSAGNSAAALSHAERLRDRAPMESASHRRVADILVLRDEFDQALETLEVAHRLAEERKDQEELLWVRVARSHA